MNRKIVFGSLIVCFLILIIPNINAVEYNTLINESNEELSESLSERIEELKVHGVSFKLFFKPDPDGPFEGGLDDFSDWNDLGLAIIFGGAFLVFIKMNMLKNAIESGYFTSVLIWIYDYYIYFRSCLEYLGDALDVIDPDEDGS